jgi:Uma2 family endonuclease
MPGGSTTLRKKLAKRGLEPDECFWITNAHHMAGKRRLNLDTDPPPDLAIEVDVTSSSLDRMSIYGELGVPEVWRVDEAGVTFHRRRADGAYRLILTSQLFPRIKAALIERFLQTATKVGDIHVALERFRRQLKRLDG